MAAASATSVNKDMETSMERLSTGKRINSAADDAAGVAIASRMTSEVKGINQAIRNAQDGQALLNTAEGATIEVENMLQRMRELSVQAANDTNSDNDRVNLQLEVDQLLTEIDRVSSSTTWGGKALLGGADGAASNFTFQVGAGTGPADQVNFSVGATSSVALGVGSTGAAIGGRTEGHASMSYADGKLTIVGQPEQGDNFTLTINNQSIDVDFSTTDEFTDDAAGAAAQIKAAIEADAISNPTLYSGLSVVDNGDGSLSISQSNAATLDTYADGVGASTATIDAENGIITFTGTIAATDTPAFNVNGTTVTVTRSATDGYSLDAVGNAAALKAAIETEDGLENVIVTDHGDGSLTITQSSVPFVEAAEVTLTTDPDISISFDDVDEITIEGAFVEGQTLSFDLFGETISFTTSSVDGYDDTLAGIASQMAAAINDAGISGISAEKTASTNSVTLTAEVESGNAVVNSGSQFIATTIGSAATSSIAISGTDVAVASATAATYTAGDAYTFEVAGHELKLVIGADGYGNDDEGVAQQMKDLVDGLGIVGLTVAVDVSTTAQIDITRDMTLAGASGGSTVVTNVSSLAADEMGGPTFSGSISVTSAAASADAITRIDAALEKLNSQRAELGAVTNRLDSTVSNLTNIATNIEESRGRIEDADFAAESTALSKSQILAQASTAMLAQANASKQGVLSLLQG